MPDREKVILGLRCHKAGFYEECLKCPYHDDGCETTLCNDAIALLKEQDARVMTLEELQAIGTTWNRNTPPYLFVERRSPTDSRWMSWGFMCDSVRWLGIMRKQNYGSKWRVWNLQPTPEQMRDTPWEGDSDD